MNLEQVTPSQDIRDVIRQKIEEYIQDFDSREQGIFSLAKLSKVSDRTIYRLLSPDEKINPQRSTLYNLVAVLLNSNNDEEFLSNVQILLQDRGISSILNDQKVEKVKLAPLEVTRFLKSDQTARILFLSVLHKRMDIEQVQSEFGNMGLLTLKKLEVFGVFRVSETGEIIHLKEIYFDDECDLLLFNDLLSHCYKLENLDVPGSNMHRYLFGRVNKVTYNELLKIDQKAFLEKKALLENFANEGEIPFWSISAIDTFEFKNNNLSNQDKI